MSPIEDALPSMQRSISGVSHVPEQATSPMATIVQDPSTRTIETLYREISGLESVMTLLFASQREVADAKAKGVAREFELVERYRIEQKSDTKQAVDAALTAQKEAVKEQTTASSLAINKSETATFEQLRQTAANLTTSIQSVTDLLNDAKTQQNKLEVRVGNIEVSKVAVTEVKSHQQGNQNTWIGFAGVAIALLVILLDKVPL